jgi:deoxycytidylate deaminase
MLGRSFSDSELVLGLIGAVGTDLESVRNILTERLSVIGYKVTPVRITERVIPDIVTPATWDRGDEYSRLVSLMDAGDKARKQSGDNSILALGAAAYINSLREKSAKDQPEHRKRHAYVVWSIKHPDEVERLRAIYPHGFYLIGVHFEENRRRERLEADKRITDDAKIEDLIRRDEHGQLDHGQRVSDTFHLSDFFVRIGGDSESTKRSVWRILALLFGHPYVTPTFDEHAMFMAFASSLHSADLSRQVGAVVAANDQVLAVGANDVPRFRGGQYWSPHDQLPEDLGFPEDGRDFARGFDANKKEQLRIIDEILCRGAQAGLDRAHLAQVLEDSRIRDITEFGRVVHAEMDALLACARTGIPTRGATLYSTTFPCHNCAKHIVSAGVSRVVFIEPYAKSKALEFHPDSIRASLAGSDSGSEREFVTFEPFMGVGPRRFFDLFSTRLSSGYPIKRNDAGNRLPWKPEDGRLRLQMQPASYLDLELLASDMFNKARSVKEESDAGQ